MPSANTTGSHNIIIQNINDSTLTLNVNGENTEIKNQLTELKKLLLSQKAQTVQYADKIYNIGHINEANFGFVTGKKAFNEHLTKSLIQAMQAHSKSAQRFLQKVANRPNWASERRISDKAKEVIAYSFVGVIGIQLSKLMAIGKEDLSETKQRKYIEKCLHLVKRTLDLTNFALLSRLWDVQKQNALSISDNHQKILTQRFDNAFESSIKEQVQLFQVLHEVFKKNDLPFPMTELADFQEHLTNDSAFLKNCTELQALHQRFDQAQFDLLICHKAESLLATFFSYFPFLVRYNMASIKRIGYRQIRNDDPHYLHRYAALGIDSKANVDAEKVIYTPETAYTDAVLLYQGKDYQVSTNLFPFVIDYNALTFEHGAKICFFQAKSMNDDSLEYLFLEDSSIVHLEKKGILKADTDFNELMMDDEKRKILNLDVVVSAFEEARKTILRDDLDFGDLLDD